MRLLFFLCLCVSFVDSFLIKSITLCPWQYLSVWALSGLTLLRSYEYCHKNLQVHMGYQSCCFWSIHFPGSHPSPLFLTMLCSLFCTDLRAWRGRLEDDITFHTESLTFSVSFHILQFMVPVLTILKIFTVVHIYLQCHIMKRTDIHWLVPEIIC